jgi:hypothetical protein
MPQPPTDPTGDPASLHYGDGEFAILKPGSHVLCAVTGRRIALPALRYWSTERQEAYAGPYEVMQRISASA